MSMSNPHDDIKLAPSILAADVARLADQVAQAVAAGADRIHVDVMDGHFVPNITFGPVIVRWLKPACPVPMEVHLMIAEPDRYLDAFAEAGADTLIVHQEGVDPPEPDRASDPCPGQASRRGDQPGDAGCRCSRRSCRIWTWCW